MYEFRFIMLNIFQSGFPGLEFLNILHMYWSTLRKKPLLTLVNRVDSKSWFEILNHSIYNLVIELTEELLCWYRLSGFWWLKMSVSFVYFSSEAPGSSGAKGPWGLLILSQLVPRGFVSTTTVWCCMVRLVPAAERRKRNERRKRQFSNAIDNQPTHCHSKYSG